MIIRGLSTLTRMAPWLPKSVPRTPLKWKICNNGTSNRAPNFQNSLRACSESHFIYDRNNEDTDIRRYVVVDCDPGNDDAWGLLALIKAEEAYQQLEDAPSKFKILAITCVQGNTDVDNATKNTLRILNSVNRTDIPVYRGCARPLIPLTFKPTFCYNGKDGFGDLEHQAEVNMRLVQKSHAVSQMYRLVLKYPKMIDFILIGPLTNFAMCINMYGSCFLDRVGRVFIMGGNYRGKGNVTRCGEFNFIMDPEAAHVVLSNLKEPAVIVPWETCEENDMGLTVDWRLNELSKGTNSAMPLLNSVEKAVLATKPGKNWVLADALLVVSYLMPQAIKRNSMYHAAVELYGKQTRSQMIIDHFNIDPPNVDIVMDVDKEIYQDVIKSTAEVEDAQDMTDLLIEYSCKK